MVDIQPFYGLRYNLEKVSDLSAVISPPYDVISPQQQTFYYRKSPYNIIRLELGQGSSSDEDKYIRAANLLSRWLKEGILIREKAPAFYLVEHRHSRSNLVQSNNSKSCWGLIAAVRLEDLDSGKIRPTEQTLKEPILDRLYLLRACQANLSPIIGVFNQPKESFLALFSNLDLNHPLMSAVDEEGVVYNLWVINEEKNFKKINRFFAAEVLYIADGHHRYTTALTYRNEQLATHPDSTGREAFNFVMMTLISAQDSGLVLLPFHRLVRGIEPEKLTQMRDHLMPYFSIEELPQTSPSLSKTLRGWLTTLAARGNKGTAIGLYGPSPGKFWLLSPHERANLSRLMPEDKPLAWKGLDVSLLHWVVLRKILGIESEEREKECLEYSSDGLEVIRKVIEGEYQLAFFLNPPSISQVLAVADANVRMPQKSNYFYPKTPAGLVINPLF